MILNNKYNKEELRKKLHAEDFRRITFSFYRYVLIDELEKFRDDLYLQLNKLGVFGRIYIAEEGVNAQISIPEHYFEEFKKFLQGTASLSGVPLKIAVEDDGKSFYKLIVRIKHKIVADGLNDDTFDVTNVGNHLSAKEFNDAMQDPHTIVIDMRNHYESEVGRFENALCPDADTFRDALPKALDMVKGKEDHKILLYCTGGIRCEKASSFFKHQGFKDVNQLLGGIIDYARQVKDEKLETKFIGKNFVFDDRLGERITTDIISVCHQCGKPSDRHVNCANNDCHLLFIQCEDCTKEFKGCCMPRCKEIAALPIEAQRLLRKGKEKKQAHAVYKSRLRPNLREMLGALRLNS